MWLVSFLGDSFSSKVKYTFVNGHLAYNDGVIDDTVLEKKLNLSHEKSSCMSIDNQFIFV